MTSKRILIVDDNYDKVKDIIKTLKSNDIHVDVAVSSRCALVEMKKVKYDLLVIDLQIPEALGEDIDQEGGVKLIQNIEVNTIIHKPNKILGITSHHDSYKNSKNEFETRGWVMHLSNGEFEKITSAIISQIKYTSTNKSFHVAIITALHETELEAVLKYNSHWTEFNLPDDPTTYFKCNIINSKGKKLDIVAVSCHGMGMANSSTITTKVCLKFEPKYLLMTGIAAGIEGKVQLGDILISESCWDWGSGKQTIRDGKAAFLASPKQETIEERMRITLRAIVRSRQFLDEIYNQWPNTLRPSNALSAHLGPIATGSVVLEDPSVVEAIKLINRDTIGIEMEAYGFMLASKLSSSSTTHALVVKSVCDFADPSKDDSFQGYAAHTSATFAFKLIEEIFDFND